ncbi:hypothetical protein [Sphaerobacter sp.]|uniref:hypothetical protein n=1 Tax=Sphaerobacter sp. TaxID=2099654 RepID=UPI001D6E7E4D|nr:hypothetical protein [Sphaerobacter sp.]MBX5443855.1 hypothetical protein [Sphaerobacter sp.]
MNWPAGLVAAGFWVLLSAVWAALQPALYPVSTTRLAGRVVRDLAPALLLGWLVARLA